MLRIKETESGRVQLTFDNEYKKEAYTIAQMVLQGRIEGRELISSLNRLEGSQDDKVVSLATIKGRIENPTQEVVHETLPAENEADIISAIIFEKIESTFGKSVPVYFTVFYKDLEKATGYALTRIHRNRTEGKDTREYPFRKIDSVLTVLSYQYVKEFAEGYFFKNKREVI